jgi:hypothetical protein
MPIVMRVKLSNTRPNTASVHHTRSNEPPHEGNASYVLFMYFIQHCFIFRPSDSTVSKDAGFEPRTVAILALAVRRSARFHPRQAGKESSQRIVRSEILSTHHCAPNPTLHWATQLFQKKDVRKNTASHIKVYFSTWDQWGETVLLYPSYRVAKVKNLFNFKKISGGLFGFFYVCNLFNITSFAASLIPLCRRILGQTLKLLSS